LIYLVRHGEAAASWGDHPDPGLSAKGRAQAHGVAEQLIELGADRFICSPMQRCRETAEPFANKIDQAEIIEPSISEIRTPDGVPDRVSWLRNLMGGVWPDNMLPWCQSAYATVKTQPDGTAVFSHFVAINAIAGVASADRRVLVFKPDHCSITAMERDAFGELQIVDFGDAAETKIL